jgi:succinate dehydrogenase / fumarate reductase membrane anchor subunit
MSANKSTAMRSYLGKARGLGSAKDGVGHWWLQRLSALFLIPLVLWFVFSFVNIADGSPQQIASWFSSPFVAIAMLLMLSTMYFHAYQGLKVVVEDYIHNERVKISLLVFLKLFLISVTLVSVFSIMKLHFFELANLS